MDKPIEVAVIIGTYKTEDKEELKFIKNMTDIFSAFVKTGLLTKGNDLSFEKMSKLLAGRCIMYSFSGLNLLKTSSM